LCNGGLKDGEQEDGDVGGDGKGVKRDGDVDVKIRAGLWLGL
jgi:hypothetical protein